jgi:hypothetical protein
LKQQFGFILLEKTMMSALWKRFRVARTALCSSPVPALKLPGGVRNSFSVSSALDYCLITNVT